MIINSLVTNILNSKAKLILVIYWIFLFTLTTLPTVPIDLGFQWQDKVNHTIAFTILSFLIYNYLSILKYSRKKNIIITFIVIAIYAAFDELHQPYFGRICDIWDFVFDLIGGIIGIILYLKYSKMVKDGNLHKTS